MEVLENNNIEVKQSKYGQPVPVVNSIHLHSIYDPIKEASTLLEKYKDQLKENNHLLVLGLGFGYHVSEGALNLRRNFGDEYEILVLEPNQLLFDKYNESIKDTDPNTKIIVSDNVDDIFSNAEIADFLLKRPVIIPHPASFNLYKNFFRAYLSYVASDYLRCFRDRIQDEQLKQYLVNHDQNLRFHELVDQIKYDKNQLNQREDFFFLALDSLAPASEKQEQE